MIEISGPKSLTLPASLGGNNAIYGLTLVCVSRGLFVKDLGDGKVKIDGIRDTSLVSVQIVRNLVAAGAEVEGYPAFFEVSDKDAVCPFGNGSETWSQWGVFGDSHKIVQIGEKWYKPSAYGESGQHLAASVWAAVAGLVVLSDVEYKALLSTEQE